MANIAQAQNTQQTIRLSGISISTKGTNDVSSTRLHRLAQRAQKIRNEFPKRVTLDQIHQIADKLTLYVRAKGYTFDSILLPPQKIKNGTIQLRYQRAVLKKVHVINKTKHPDKVFTRAFNHLMNLPLYAPDVESVVYSLQDQPNIRVFAFFSRGKNIGEITLNLRVNTHKPTHYSLRFDNNGSEVSGQNRLIADLKGYGLISSFDRLSAAVLTSVDTASDSGTSTYGFIRYRVLTPRLKQAFSISGGNSGYLIGKNYSMLDMEGESQTLQAGVTSYQSTKKKFKSQTGFNLVHKSSLVHSNVFNSIDNKTQSLSAKLSLDQKFQSSQDRWQLAYGLTGTLGSFSETSGANVSQGIEGEDTFFKKLNYYAVMTAVPYHNHSLSIQPKLYIRGQKTDSTDLPGIETVSLGGDSAIRALQTGTSSADSAILASLDIDFPIHFPFNNTTKRESHQVRPTTSKEIKSPWYRHLTVTPFVFYDWTKAQKNTGEASETFSFSGIGTGIKITWMSLSGKLAFAKLSHSSVFNVKSSENQVYIQMRWN